MLLGLFSVAKSGTHDDLESSLVVRALNAIFDKVDDDFALKVSMSEDGWE